MKQYHAVVRSPVGFLGIITDEDSLLEVDFLSKGNVLPAKTMLAKKVVRQLEDYFQNPSSGFDLPLQATGTEFQQQVWQVMRGIPAGEVMTYGQVAEVLNSSPRAVGNACRANPIPIIVPCHRIVSKQGIGGFAGKTSGRDIRNKRELLEHEGWKG
jgi:methylated-DNA-[protein]-cysteine S-methyltransferase